jgi:hypothetical protein
MKQMAMAAAILIAGCGGAKQVMREEALPEPAHEIGGGDRAATNRPGLGTEFGERRSSGVRLTSFDRCADTPYASLAVNYDDESGVSAMIDRDLRAGERVHALAVDPQGEVAVAIVDEQGEPLPGVSVGSRTYVVGEHGRRYEIIFTNEGARRFEIVTSVDGLDVIDGLDASTSKRGYVLEPYAQLRIEGFRTSEAEVAAFRFGAVGESYAARTGDARNVGVIGVAMFCERAAPAYAQPPPPSRDDEAARRQQANPFPQ